MNSVLKIESITIFSNLDNAKKLKIKKNYN